MWWWGIEWPKEMDEKKGEGRRKEGRGGEGKKKEREKGTDIILCFE